MFYNENDAEDIALWHEVTKSLKPLSKPKLLKKSAKAVTLPPLPIFVTKNEDAPKAKIKLEALSKKNWEKLLTTPIAAKAVKNGDISHGAGAELASIELRKLKQKKDKPQARIDLHGLDQAQAHLQLNQFILAQHRSGNRRLLVITGKGSGILQRSVPIWLNQTPLKPFLRGFSYAARHDGEQGALYVFLKEKPNTQSA